MYHDRALRPTTLSADLAQIDRLDHILTSLAQTPDSGPRSLAVAALRQGLDAIRIDGHPIS